MIIISEVGDLQIFCDICRMEQKNRLASLDVLRGLDLWLLLLVGPVVQTFLWSGFGKDWELIRYHAVHAPWQGFAVWDIVMPLFLFMSGITIPFSMNKYKSGVRPGKEFWMKLLRRLILLFFLGWIVQGNLLSFSWKDFHPFANTLQAIAVGYVFSAIIFVGFKARGQILITALLFIAYLLPFVFTGMNMDPQDNVAMLIDKAVLGSHRDGVIWAEDGTWMYDSGYSNTWILSSLNFIVTVMLGCFAGEIIRKDNLKPSGRKAVLLAVTGIILIAAGLLMDPFYPIIKRLWTGSMALFSGGICFVLMAIVYYLVDVKGWTRGTECLKYFGMNSIAAYVIGQVIVFSSVTNSLLHGFEQWLGAGYPVLITFGNVLILFFIMRWMYKSRIFLKV